MGAAGLQHGPGPDLQPLAVGPPGAACGIGRVRAAMGVERQVVHPARAPGLDLAGQHPDRLGELCLLLVDRLPMPHHVPLPRIEPFGQ